MQGSKYSLTLMTIKFLVFLSSIRVQEQTKIKVCFIHSCMIPREIFIIFEQHWDNKNAFFSCTWTFLRYSIFVKISQLNEHKVLYCTSVLKWNVKLFYCSVDNKCKMLRVFAFLHARIFIIIIYLFTITVSYLYYIFELLSFLILQQIYTFYKLISVLQKLIIGKR